MPDWDFNPSKVVLPSVLAGPILRRATPSKVWIWLATSFDPASVEGVVFVPSNDPPVRGNAQTVKLGAQLFVHLITIEPEDPRKFPTDTILQYKINIRKSEGDDASDLGHYGLGSALNIVAGESELCEKFSEETSQHRFDNPTFIIQSEQKPLRVLYGSCRKHHGEGPDTLLAAREILRCFAAEPDRRPQALFLTGDQIYADDVSDLLISYLARLGVALTGYEEEIPGLEDFPTDMIRGREKLLPNPPFTSDKKTNHLIRFGGYAAMYLLSWNPALWPKALPNRSQYLAGREKALQYYPINERTSEKEILDQYEEVTETIDVDRGRNSAYSAQELFANIACYMGFDDHEVTDDWNLNPALESDMKGSATGSRILANALAAFWAFQGWGNDPDEYSDQFVSAIEDHLGSEGGSGEKFEKVLTGFHDWSFETPTNPRALFLDTRTRREKARAKRDVFNGKTKLRPPAGYPWLLGMRPAFKQNPNVPLEAFAPRLLDRKAVAGVVETVRQMGRDGGGPTILITPGPILGFELVDQLQQFLIKGGGGTASWDLESWSSNMGSLLDFFDIVAKSPTDVTVVLSGDVHYGFGVEADLHIEGQDRSHSVFQFTSSALKNISYPGYASTSLNLFSGRTSHSWFWESGSRGLIEVFDEGAHEMGQAMKPPVRPVAPSLSPDVETTSEAVDKRNKKSGRFDYELTRRYMEFRSGDIFERRNNVGYLTIWRPGRGRNQLFVYDENRNVRLSGQFEWPHDVATANGDDS